MTKGRWIATVLILGLVGFAAYQGLKPRPPPSRPPGTSRRTRR